MDLGWVFKKPGTQPNLVRCEVPTTVRDVGRGATLISVYLIFEWAKSISIELNAILLKFGMVLKKQFLTHLQIHLY